MSAPEHTRPATPPDRDPSDQTDPDGVQPRAQPDAAAPDDARPEPTRTDPTRTDPTRTEAADEVAPAVGLAAGDTSTGRAGGPAPTLPRLRRPSGYPPPLPHHWRRRNVALLLGLAVWVVVWSSAYLAGQVVGAAGGGGGRRLPRPGPPLRPHRRPRPGGRLRRPATAAELPGAGHDRRRGRAGPVPPGLRAAGRDPARPLPRLPARRRVRPATPVRRGDPRPVVGLRRRPRSPRRTWLPPPSARPSASCAPAGRGMSCSRPSAAWCC